MTHQDFLIEAAKYALDEARRTLTVDHPVRVHIDSVLEQIEDFEKLAVAVPPETPRPDLKPILERVERYAQLVGMSYSERFEDQADRFYRQMHMLAPGKSQPMEMSVDEGERNRAWKIFQDAERDRYQSDLRTLIAEISCSVESVPPAPKGEK